MNGVRRCMTRGSAGSAATGAVLTVNQPQLVSVGNDIELSSVVEALESDGVCQGTDGTRFVLPGGAGDTGDPLLGGDLALVDGHLAEGAGGLKVLQGVGHDGVEVDLATKVPAQVAEVGGLLDDGTTAAGLVPPVELGSVLVGHDVAGVGGHDLEVVLVEDLLHLLDDLEVAQHVANADDVLALLEEAGNGEGLVDGAGGDGLLDEDGSLGECLDEVLLQVTASLLLTTEGRGRSDPDGAERGKRQGGVVSACTQRCGGESSHGSKLTEAPGPWGGS